jgi:hypothetical protein
MRPVITTYLNQSIRLPTLVYFSTWILCYSRIALIACLLLCDKAKRICILRACCSSETSRIAALPYLNPPIAEASPRRSHSSHGRRPRVGRHVPVRPSIRYPPTRFHTLIRRQCDALEHERGAHWLCRSPRDLAVRALDTILLCHTLQVCLHEPMDSRRLAATGPVVVSHHMVCALPKPTQDSSNNSIGSSVF